jgi:hypothetical protein
MRRLLSFLTLALATSAEADTTAIYAHGEDVCSMTVEIASNGDLRGEIKGNFMGMPGQTYYFVGGKDYLVDRTDQDTAVMRLDDVVQVMSEVVARDAPITNFPIPPPMKLVRGGAVRINKWSGEAYYMQTSNGGMSPKPVVVISHDPSLAELGKAMGRQFATSEKMMARVMQGHAPKTNMDEVLSLGAPISFAGAELRSISLDPIPKAEFILPGQPLPIDQVRRRMNAMPGRFSATTKATTKRTPDVPCHIVIQG